MDNPDNRVLGSTRLFDLSDANRSVEIGWTWLTPAVWRTRVNTECKMLLLTHAFETMGAIRVQLKTDSRNVRSREAIERIGGVFEGILRSHRIMPDGYLRDSVYYSILDKEWPVVKRRLEAMLAARAEDFTH
jgi:RimJ/RimL family protein N-acetyltransferase